MVIAVLSLIILVVAICISVRSGDLPMDRDVVLRMQRLSEDMRRKELLPFD